MARTKQTAIKVPVTQTGQKVAPVGTSSASYNVYIPPVRSRNATLTQRANDAKADGEAKRKVLPQEVFEAELKAGQIGAWGLSLPLFFMMNSRATDAQSRTFVLDENFQKVFITKPMTALNTTTKEEKVELNQTVKQLGISGYDMFYKNVLNVYEAGFLEIVLLLTKAIEPRVAQAPLNTYNYRNLRYQYAYFLRCSAVGAPAVIYNLKAAKGQSIYTCKYEAMINTNTGLRYPVYNDQALTLKSFQPPSMTDVLGTIRDVDMTSNSAYDFVFGAFNGIDIRVLGMTSPRQLDLNVAIVENCDNIILRNIFYSRIKRMAREGNHPWWTVYLMFYHLCTIARFNHWNYNKNGRVLKWENEQLNRVEKWDDVVTIEQAMKIYLGQEKYKLHEKASLKFFQDWNTFKNTKGNFRITNLRTKFPT